MRLCDSCLQEGPEVGSRFENTQIFLSTIDSLEHWMLIGQKHLLGTSSKSSIKHVTTSSDCLSGRHVTKKMRFFELTTNFFDENFEKLEFSIFAAPWKKFLIIILSSPSYYPSNALSVLVRKIFSCLQEGLQCWSFIKKST